MALSAILQIGAAGSVLIDTIIAEPSIPAVMLYLNPICAQLCSSLGRNSDAGLAYLTLVLGTAGIDSGRREAPTVGTQHRRGQLVHQT